MKEDQKPAKQAGIHEGHRARMLNRFCETGFIGFQPHEIMEMLLYYVVPRRDTNPLAHRLIDRFGSVAGAMQATPEALRSVEGVTERMVQTFRFFREINSYCVEELSAGKPMASAKTICEFFSALYRYEHKEIIRAMFLDSKLHMTRCRVIAEGHPTESALLFRSVTELAFAEHCSAVILAHNHPNGPAAASAEDIAATRILYDILKKCGIDLIDHIIVGQDCTVSLREEGVLCWLD